MLTWRHGPGQEELAWWFGTLLQPRCKRSPGPASACLAWAPMRSLSLWAVRLWCDKQLQDTVGGDALRFPFTVLVLAEDTCWSRNRCLLPRTAPAARSHTSASTQGQGCSGFLGESLSPHIWLFKDRHLRGTSGCFDACLGSGKEEEGTRVDEHQSDDRLLFTEHLPCAFCLH